MADPRRTGGDHRGHDLELIARVSAGDGTSADRLTATALETRCAACRLLAADLRSITLAVRSLRSDPPDPAPRDFRITATDARRLRPGRVGGFLSGLRGAGAFRARLGGGLVAIGLVGILLGGRAPGSVPGLGAAGGAAGPEIHDTKATASMAVVFGPVSTAADRLSIATDPNRDGAAAPVAAPATSWSAVVLVLSGAAAIVGIGLLLAPRGGRRSGP